jgi:maltose alpha-D-glucosyltransferase / alpha-amylase
MSIQDLWYRNAVIYCLDVEKYMDCNGDGVGDFEGLSRRLDYLSGIGVSCVWLQPFYPSPNRDNGYDVCDYYGVHARHGNLGDFVEFVNHARALGIRIIVDLVVNHTSVEHPWFQAGLADPCSRYGQYYVWSKKRPADHASGIVFPGTQTTTWTYERHARQYYFHRFHDCQPDLNTVNPLVREEIKKIMGFWLQLGVSGFRMDAVPFLIERKGAHVDPGQDFGMLKEMRSFLQWRSRDAVMLAEANVLPDESLQYFGEEGNGIQMMLNFWVNQHLFYALATEDTVPLRQALKDTQKRPPNAQWVNFLRSHDELDLGRLTENQRRKVFEAFGPDPGMQLYDRGIRRRLAPMLGNDRRKLELAFSLLFSLPGTPMMQYGDEIGMGDDLELPERECARTPMQWTAENHGGFSAAEQIVRPAIDDEIFGYRTVNVAAQRRDPHSLLSWTERAIRVRMECSELSWGDFEILDCGLREVLALKYRWRDTAMVTLHNFSAREVRFDLVVDEPRGEFLADSFGDRHSRADGRAHRIVLDPYDYRWFQVGSVDNTLLLAEPR